MKKLAVLMLVSLFLIGSTAFASQSRTIRSLSFSSSPKIVYKEPSSPIGVTCVYQGQPVDAHVYVYEIWECGFWHLVEDGETSGGKITFDVSQGKDYAVDAVRHETGNDGSGIPDDEIKILNYEISTKNYPMNPYVWPYHARVYVYNLQSAIDLQLNLKPY